ncbi:MAG: glycine cleavage system aminomethyltransferase GcvT [Proteobacteria bacterium]|nr:glycine cleavage system aminomethyltransferase GcvT [Pseudomonadota bacterium]
MKKTPLHESHLALKAKMGAFAGYDMPLYYGMGVMKEHEWARAHAGLFDVSHMGQIIIEGPEAVAFWESVTPSSFSKLANGAAKYTILTNEKGGIIDDLIVTRLEDEKFFAVLNAGRKNTDIEWLRKNLPATVNLDYSENQALIALQGPSAQKIMFDEFGLALEDMDYMTGKHMDMGGIKSFISRLGYTGEDGFELSIPAESAPAIWALLLAHEEVKPVGLAARDSLRLEMGYCLYGHDIDENTSPVAAGLGWVMSKNNRGFIGAPAVLKEKETGPTRKRAGIILTGPGVAREGSAVFDESGSKEIGRMTSGGFSPSLKKSVGQGYIDAGHAAPGAKISIDVRGKKIPAETALMPFLNPKTKAVKAAVKK